jgi:hypothetical protein
MKIIFLYYSDKTVYDAHREKILLEQLVRLTDERNIAAFPPAGSGIPGELFI